MTEGHRSTGYCGLCCGPLHKWDTFCGACGTPVLAHAARATEEISSQVQPPPLVAPSGGGRRVRRWIVPAALLVVMVASAGCGGEGASGAAEEYGTTEAAERIDDAPTGDQYTEEETQHRDYQVLNIRNDTDTTGRLTGYDIPTARANVVTRSYEGLEQIGHELYLEGEREGYDIVVVGFSVDEGYGMEPAETYVYFANPDLEEIYYDRMDQEHETLKGN